MSKQQSTEPVPAPLTVNKLRAILNSIVESNQEVGAFKVFICAGPHNSLYALKDTANDAADMVSYTLTNSDDELDNRYLFDKPSLPFNSLVIIPYGCQ